MKPEQDIELERWKNFASVFNDDDDIQTGFTEREAVWKKNKATLWRYTPSAVKYSTPLFMVYSPVNEPFILDLQPGISAIESFINHGFDVYLLDFGVPDDEDKDFSMADYILLYIKEAAEFALCHSGAADLTVIGYCLGGTLAAIYASIAGASIRNLILFSTPIDFRHVPLFDEWIKALREKELDFNEIIDHYGVLPASHVEAGIRLITSPIYYSPHLTLLAKANDPEYVMKWRRFNKWTKSYIPMPGAVLKDLIHDFVKKNKLVKGKLKINGQKADLKNIKANVLVIASAFDRLVPKEQSEPIMKLISSKDKEFRLIQNGHVPLTVKDGQLPELLADWLPKRSKPIL
ncbi:alpha/beta fold hydrolase [Metabacillus idriensis]|uniref:alpha/beta fold hydrolase n=1 Tax=Metabacillus idriensis TaxID=324768 RepID=UPI003D2ACDE6